MNKPRFVYPNLILVVTAIALTFALTVTAQEVVPKPVNTEKLVNTDWLANNLTMADLRIVDIRDNVTAYWLEHIPGAVYISPDAIRWPDQGVPVKLIPPKDLANLLGKMGINNKTIPKKTILKHHICYGRWIIWDTQSPQFLMVGSPNGKLKIAQ
jgi:hypothetical protein